MFAWFALCTATFKLLDEYTRVFQCIECISATVIHVCCFSMNAASIVLRVSSCIFSTRSGHCLLSSTSSSDSSPFFINVLYSFYNSSSSHLVTLFALSCLSTNQIAASRPCAPKSAVMLLTPRRPLLMTSSRPRIASGGRESRANS